MTIEIMKKSIVASITLVLLMHFGTGAEIQATVNQNNMNLEDSIRSRLAIRKGAMKRYVPKILGLQKEINKGSAIFLISPRLNKDAGPFLNPRVEWQDVVNDKTSKTAYEKYMASLGVVKVNKLSLPSQTTERLKSLGPDYYKNPSEFDLKVIDFGWFKELQKYDYWNIEVNSPLAYLDRFDFTQNPVPNLVSLILWSKLRLIKGIQEKNIKSAIDETVHLGKLLHSTETLIGAVSSIAILKSVSQFAKDQGAPLAVDATVLDKAKLYFMALPKALGNPVIDIQDYTQISQAGSGPGYCAAVNEAGSGLLMYKPLLEIDLKDIYAKYGAILNSQAPCRWVNIRRAWTGDTKYVIHFKSLPSASLEARRQATELIKQSLSDDDYKKLIAEVSNPRWPQYFGYLLALQFTPESMFSNLDSK